MPEYDKKIVINDILPISPKVIGYIGTEVTELNTLKEEIKTKDGLQSTNDLIKEHDELVDKLTYKAPSERRGISFG